MFPDFQRAQWIWVDKKNDDTKPNLNVCFRQSFHLDTLPRECILSVSADCRYVLYVNGEQVAQGPARSWPHKKQYDKLDLSRWLTQGENLLAFQVVRWGVSCSHDTGEGPGGLLAEVQMDGKPVLWTDSDWKALPQKAWRRNVPRHAYGMTFSEQVDARLDMPGWKEKNFDDSPWPSAQVLGPCGMEPFVEMVERSIPLLLEQRVYPKRAYDFRAVKPPECALFLDLYPAAMEVKNDLSFGYELCGILVGVLEADREGQATLIRMNTSYDLDAFNGMRLNGEDLEFQQDRAVLNLKSGRNLLTCRVENHYQSYPSWMVESDLKVSFRSPFEPDSPFALYPVETLEGDEAGEKIWAAREEKELGPYAKKIRAFAADEVLTDLYAICNGRQELPGQKVEMANREALYSDSAESATLWMPPEGDAEFLLDFGEEMVGYLEFSIQASQGTVVDLNAFEAIWDNQWVWTDNLNNTLRYTCQDGWQTFRSPTRRGFRYVQVTIRNAKKLPRIAFIRNIKSTFPVEQQGMFQCSDGNLNTLYDMGVRTTQLCMEDTFVDCPAYEQTFWVGDCRNESLVGYSVFGDTRLIKRCLSFAAETLFRSPIPEQNVPWRDAWKNLLPDWALFWVLSCRELYEFEGDKAYLREIFPAVRTTCKSFCDRRGEDGLMRFPGWNMLDWAPMDCLPGSATCHENGWLVKALEDAAWMADEQGEDDGPWCRKQAAELREAMNRHLWNPEKEAYADSIRPDGTLSTVFSQQSQTVALLSGCVPPDRVETVKTHILNAPKDWVHVQTPFMAWFCFEAFEQMGEHQAILDWMRRYWGFMAKKGATTCWEHIEGSSCSSYRWEPTRSWCHAWSAAPAYFLPRYQLGVQRESTGFKKVRVAPLPLGLTWAQGRVPTPFGPMQVQWELEGNTFHLQVIAPEAIEVEAVYPEGYQPGRIDVQASNSLTHP